MKLNREDIHVLNIILFSVVAILHLLRLIFNIDVIIGTHNLPLWVSALGVIVLASLIWVNWRLTKRTKKTCAKIIAGILIVDLAGIIGFWAKGIEFLGFKGTSYAYIAILDIILITTLLWYVKKK